MKPRFHPLIVCVVFCVSVIGCVRKAVPISNTTGSASSATDSNSSKDGSRSENGSKIDSSFKIGRDAVIPLSQEPSYSHSPLYALLVFGENAEHQSWLVMDGEKALYVDRDGDGDMTQSNDRIAITKDAADRPFHRDKPLSETEYLGMNEFQFSLHGHDFKFLYWVTNPEFVPPKDGDGILDEWRVERKKNGWFSASLMRTIEGGGAQIPVTLCGSPEKAQISHIDGPLTFQTKWGDRQVLQRSGDNTFDVHVGTVGVPTANQDRIPFASLSTVEVPSTIHPVAEFEFTDAQGRPIKRSVDLVQRC